MTKFNKYMLKDSIMKGRQRMVTLVSLLLLALAASAVPAKPGLTRTLTLTDGSTVDATLVGDEYLHYWLGEDGKAYQAVSQQKRGAKAGSEEGDAVYQTFDVEAAKKSAYERRNGANQQRARRLAPRKVGTVGPISGNKKGIIILVNFQDIAFTATQSDFNNLANSVNYNSGNYKGSMYDYFYAQSDGQFQLTFDVVGPYTVSKNYAYYGANDSNGSDVHPGEMVVEAVNLADNDVNFANYDWDKDGYVDQVYVVYAGKGEADGGADDTIWPHEWNLYSANYYSDGSGPQTLDGVTINTYACGGEQNGSTGETAGIGTMCHEFSHCLGYPDFYDTDYSDGQGMGYWDLMSSGSYNGNGYQPAGYTSYERWVAGWKTPTELLYTQNISNMPALQTTGSDSYIIYNKANNNEYYLLENRQKTGWDASLPGEGLLILHVDYDATIWSKNKPNDDPEHQRLTWIAADNDYQYNLTSSGKRSYTFAGMKNDPFPYISENTVVNNSFGKNTTPAATLYNNNSDGTKYLDSSVENITQNSDGTISFSFKGIGNVYMPNLSPKGGRFTNDQTVTVTITAETGATIYYTTNDDTPTTASTLYTAPFTVTTTTTVKAIAVKDNEVSGVATATYTFIDPLILADQSLSFSAEAGSSETKQLTVLTEGLTQDVTLTLSDANNVFSLGANTISKSLEDATVDVTFSPTAAGTYEGTVTLTSEGAESVTVPLSATATLPPVTVPTLTVTNVTATDARATWTECDEVSTYTIQLASDDQFSTGGSGGSGETLTETFANITFTTTSSSYTDQTISGGNLGTWTATSCRGDQSSPVIRYAGTLTSPTIAAGVAGVEFDYDWPYSESGTCDIELYVGGTSMGTASVTGGTAGTATYTLDSPVPGPTSIKILNKASKDKRMRVTEVRITTPSSGSSGGGSLIAEKTVTDGTSYTFTGLSPETTYYARVKGDADWSNVEEFKTIDPVIAYYQNADGKQGPELKTAMCKIIYNRTELDYEKDVWTAYQTTDVRSDGKIWDMYSNITNYDPVNGSHANSAEGSGFNREHSFPKSWFGGEITPMFTDLHHLYPVDGNINTRRSNNPYGETNGEDYKSANNFSKIGACTNPGYTGKVFEPADEYKGDFARTYFYMVTCYEEKLQDWVTKYGATTEVDDVLDGSKYPAFNTWQLNMLMKWAKEDPVSEKETNRNNAVYAIQNNRNPFIDYPGLEEYIWGNLTTTTFDYDDYLQPARLSFSATEAMATLGVNFTEPTLTTTPANLPVTYSSSNTNVATVDSSTGEVTLVDAGSTTITATFAGNVSYSGGTASYTLTVSSPALAFGEQLFYEGLTGYTSSGDNNTELAKTDNNLNYKSWASISKVYAGGTSNAYSNGNGGCLKFGSGSASGSMTTSNISLTGGGTLTFYLKQYGSDDGTLNVTVTGATADATKFTPTSEWTLCTVNLSNVTDNVTITLATTSKRAYVDEIKLTSNGTLDLANDGDNASIIAEAVSNGGKFNVTLKDRTLYRDGKWNTLCLPFNYDLDADDSPIDGGGLTVMAFDETTSTFNDGTLTLNFTTVFDNDTYKGNLVAGTPYLIKWDEDTYNLTITNPVFYGVTIDKTTRNKTCDLGGGKSITFCGTYGQLTYTAADKSILFLGEENTLYYPDSGASIGAQRAFFQFTGLEAKTSAPSDGEGAGNVSASPIRAFVLNFGEDASSINEKVIVNTPASVWYTLDGRKLSGKPSVSGLYINNGKKVVIK